MSIRVFALLAVALSATAAFGQREFGFDNRKGSGQPYLKPEETVAKMKVADGFEVKLFAGEPQLVNPIAMTVDEKGRVWVIECFEYPKKTPKGKMPRDRIKILEDTDGDGVCDKVTIFAEGKDFPVPFDMASGIEVGNGGVYVGAPPYLFFIENKDDKPGKFEVLLKGFGSEDTHETLNTFQWGPDGRLYGLHGVFTHSNVSPGQADGPTTRMNAAVWRYDTKTKKFEIFSEGTSNPWGMDWRNTDGQFILCCCVIPHLFHMVPGGIYKRQAGQSFNPYAYGEIKEICDHTFHRESGWAHAGLISLDTPMMPEKYRNSVIFGSIHGCSLKQNILKPNGSSYTASRGDDFLVSGDKNFRPINLRWGPNGEIYCIDWHDQNPCHQTKPDDWDYERGRVYRIQPKGLKTKKAEDLAKREPQSLTELLNDPNPYTARTALRLLGQRQFAKPSGRTSFPKVTNDIYSDWGFEAATGTPDFGGTYEIRRVEWWIQQMADSSSKRHNDDFWTDKEWTKKQYQPSLSVNVRREYASLCVRHMGRYDVRSLVHDLLNFKVDANDPIIPQLLWTAYEPGLIAKPSDELKWLQANAAGNALITDTIVPRSMRRLVATGKADDLAACVNFVVGGNDTTVKVKALEALVSAIGNRTVDAPQGWADVRTTLAKDTDANVKRLTDSLAIKFRDPEAVKRALAIAQDEAQPIAARLAAVRDLGTAKAPTTFKPLVMLAQRGKDEALQIEAVRAIGVFDEPTIPAELLANWGVHSPGVRAEIINVLAGRKEWAMALLNAVQKDPKRRMELTDNTILRMQAFNDNGVNSLIEKAWGRVRPTPAELNKVIDTMRGELAKASGSFEKGKLVFDNQCAKCHKFEGRGHEVGPNIEGAGRDIEYLLTNVLDPNRVIGAPYFMRTVNLLNGRIETGVLHAEDDQSITLKTDNAVLKQIQKKDIDSIKVQEKSLMPEGLSNNMTTQDFRNLVRYVMANPFITNVEVATFRAPVSKEGPKRDNLKPIVGVGGRIDLPNSGRETQVTLKATVTAPADMKVRLLLGTKNMAQVRIGDAAPQMVRAGGGVVRPDQMSVEVELKKGNNVLTLMTSYEGTDNALYLRFLDPDRKLRYPE